MFMRGFVGGERPFPIIAAKILDRGDDLIVGIDNDLNLKRFAFRIVGVGIQVININFVHLLLDDQLLNVFRHGIYF